MSSQLLLLLLSLSLPVATAAAIAAAAAAASAAAALAGLFDYVMGPLVSHYVIMVAADGMAPSRRQKISNHHITLAENVVIYELYMLLRSLRDRQTFGSRVSGGFVFSW